MFVDAPCEAKLFQRSGQIFGPQVGQERCRFPSHFSQGKTPCTLLAQPKEIKRKQMVSPLVPFLPVFDAWKPLIHHRSANFKTGVGNSGSPYRQSSPSFPDVKYCWQCFRFMDYRVLKRKLQSQKEIILGSRLSHGLVQGTAL